MGPKEQAPKAQAPSALPPAPGASWRNTGSRRADVPLELIARLAPGAATGNRVRSRTAVGRSNRREHQAFTALLLHGAADRVRQEQEDSAVRLGSTLGGSINSPVPALSASALGVTTALVAEATVTGDASTSLQRLATTYAPPHPFRVPASAAERTLERRGDTVAAAVEAVEAPARALKDAARAATLDTRLSASGTVARSGTGRPGQQPDAACEYGGRASALPPVAPPAMPGDVAVYGPARDLGRRSDTVAAAPKLRNELTDHHSTAYVTQPPPGSGMHGGPVTRAALRVAPLPSADDIARRQQHAATAQAKLQQHWAQRAVLDEARLDPAGRCGKRKPHAIVH